MKCSCPYPNSEMELQWVCEKCGERKGLGSALDAWKVFLEVQGILYEMKDNIVGLKGTPYLTFYDPLKK